MDPTDFLELLKWLGPTAGVGIVVLILMLRHNSKQQSEGIKEQERQRKEYAQQIKTIAAAWSENSKEISSVLSHISKVHSDIFVLLNAQLELTRSTTRVTQDMLIAQTETLQVCKAHAQRDVEEHRHFQEIGDELRQELAAITAPTTLKRRR